MNYKIKFAIYTGSQISCGIGAGGSILGGPPPSPSPSPASEGFPADAREREQGHYVAYEALHPPLVSNILKPFYIISSI